MIEMYSELCSIFITCLQREIITKQTYNWIYNYTAVWNGFYSVDG